MINCEVCGKTFKNLGWHLKKKHSLTIEEYKSKYNDAPVTIKELTKDEDIKKEIEKRKLKYTGKEGIDYIECRICGFRANTLTTHIKFGHNISIKDYKSIYKNARIRKIYKNKWKGETKETNNSIANYSKKLKNKYKQQRNENNQEYINKYVNNNNYKKYQQDIKTDKLLYYKFKKLISVGLDKARLEGKMIYTEERRKLMSKKMTISVEERKIDGRKEIENKKTSKTLKLFNKTSKGKEIASRTGKIRNKKWLNSDKFKENIEKTLKKHLDYYKKYQGITLLGEINYMKMRDGITKFHCDACNKEFFKMNFTGYVSCPHCIKAGVSVPEKKLRYVLSNVMGKEKVIYNKKCLPQPNSNYKLEIDILYPNKNIGIEYNGFYTHSEEGKDNNYHKYKTEEAEKQNIQLIHVFEDEWYSKQHIVISRLKAIFKLPVRQIYGRKCIIKELNGTIEKEFLNDNHLQGYSPSKIKYGLYYENELVSIMTFGSKRNSISGKYKENVYELLRFANKLETNILGGASKLFKYFLKNNNVEKVITYADRRWSQGKLYFNLGFKHIRNSSPNYFYLVNNQRESRLKYQKHKLVEQGFDKNKTESEIMFERGIFKIYDSGNMVFEYNT